MSLTVDQRLGTSIGSVLHVVERSQNIGLGLFALATLLRSHAEIEGSLDYVLTEGLSSLVEALSEQLGNCPIEYQSEIDSLKEYCSQA